MGRPKKNGLDYFPLDVDIFRDIRVRRLKRKCGDNATLVYIALLTLIYNEGCYLRVDDDTAFALSEDVGFNEDEINAIIAVSIELGLFSQKMYREHGILTSAAIQNRYLFIKEGDIDRIDSRYRLISAPKKPTSANAPERKKHNAEPILNNKNEGKSRVFGGKTPVSPPETPVSDPKTPVSPPKSAQSKVKKSKVKKSKEKESITTTSKSAAAAAADGGADVVASLTFPTASPLYSYTEPAERVDLRSVLSPYVTDYEAHASEIDRLTQCGHPQCKNTEALLIWVKWQVYYAGGGTSDFKVGDFDTNLRRCRARADKGEVPGIIPHNQWEALKWLGNSSQYTTSRRNRRFVVERTAQSWDTLAEMTEVIASARGNPATKNFSVAAIVYSYAKKNLGIRVESEKITNSTETNKPFCT